MKLKLIHFTEEELVDEMVNEFNIERESEENDFPAYMVDLIIPKSAGTISASKLRIKINDKVKELLWSSEWVKKIKKIKKIKNKIK